MATVAQLEALSRPAVEALGCELWGVELQFGKKQQLLRVYIDKPDGVNVEDCARVSRQLSINLDVEDAIAGEYRLEVSSPGMDRPLFHLSQYQRYVGHRVQIRLQMAFEGRKNFKGILRAIENDELIVQVDDTEYVLPFELVDRARLVPEYE